MPDYDTTNTVHDLWDEVEEQLVLLGIYDPTGEVEHVIETQSRLIRLLVELLRLAPEPQIAFPPVQTLPPRATLAATPSTGVLEYQG